MHIYMNTYIHIHTYTHTHTNTHTHEHTHPHKQDFYKMHRCSREATIEASVRDLLRATHGDKVLNLHPKSYTLHPRPYTTQSGKAI